MIPGLPLLVAIILTITWLLERRRRRPTSFAEIIRLNTELEEQTWR